MKNPYLLGGIVIVVAAAAYYFFVYKKKKEANGDAAKSNFGGAMKVVKTPCNCPPTKGLNQNTGTYRDTGVPCNAAAPGDVPKSGTIHINGWGGKACMQSSNS